MTFLIVIYIFVMTAKNLNFLGPKNGFSSFIKNAHIVLCFSIVVYPNQGVQLKVQLFWTSCYIC